MSNEMNESKMPIPTNTKNISSFNKFVKPDTIIEKYSNIHK